MAADFVDLTAVSVKDGLDSSENIPFDAKKSIEANSPMVPFSKLFRFYGPTERLMLGFGLTCCAVGGAAFPCINIAFGELLDSTAGLGNVEETTKRAVFFMIGVACVLGASLFLGFGFTSWAAVRGANNTRREYVKALMAQDVRFFDDAQAGELAAATSERCQELQNGTAKKLGEFVQAVFTGVGGIGVGFYFSWKLSLVILAGVPLLALATWGLIKATTLLQQANPAYEKAGAVATESVAAARVVAALNAQAAAAARYESHLGEAEAHATKNAWRISFANGGLFGSMFFMYAFGLWFGAYLIASSTDQAMKDYPPPAGLIDVADATWGAHANQSLALCYDSKTGERYEGDALLTCACALDYALLPTDEPLSNPNCGCGYRVGGVASFDPGNSPCVSGGTVLMVFFSVLFGGFMFGAAGASIESIVKARIAAHELHAIVDRAPMGGVGADARKPVGSDLTVAAVRGQIAFRDVHFSYGARPIFRGLSLRIPAGATVALVGESGCGKSTVGRLLERFYDPSSGAILLDGIDIASVKIDALRAAIGMVSQEPLLFQATIRANIAAGKSGVDADAVPFEEVLAAARAGMAHDFIQSFPDGYDTVVGGKNSKLSGGQKQRIAIARAALRNPPILILDEATSALDTENERLVQDALDSLVSGAKRTTIVIAHRLTTVRGADKIVVLGFADAAGGLAGGGSAEGSVVLEEGTHDALMSRPNGRYKALVGLGGGGSKNASSARLAELGNSESRSASVADAQTLQKAIAGIIADAGEVTLDVKTKTTKKGAKGEDATVSGPPVNSKRIWEYSEPEYKLLILGGFVALLNGCIFPSIAFVFAEMLSLFYSMDTEYIMKGAVTFGSIFIGISAASWLFAGVQGGLFAVVGERLTTRLRVHLFRSILRQDTSFFDDPDNSVGALTSTLRTDTSLVRAATGQSLGAAIQTFGSLCFGLTVAMMASWKYGLVLLAAVPILSIGEMINMENLATGDAAVSESMGKSAAHVNELAQTIREVKAFGLEKKMFDVYDALLSAPKIEERNKALRGAAAFGLAQGMTMLFYAFAFWWGSELITRGELNFYDFMKALWALGFCAAGAGQAAAFAGDAASAKTASSRIFSLIDRVPRIDAKPFMDGTPGVVDKGMDVRPVPLTDAHASRAGMGSILTDFKGEISFKDVLFSYPQRSGSAVLNGLSFTVAPGQTVALIGQSGSGKSTAVQLLERFYDPVTPEALEREMEETREARRAVSRRKDASVRTSATSLDSIRVEDCSGGSLSNISDPPRSGTVALDGVDVRTLDPLWLRSTIGLVEQEPVLFSGSVHENIAAGKGGVAPATREEVVEAATIANAHEFISEMENGYDSEVGVGGSLVSGGQKQRIAIARAIIGNPKILLLDEATSALDNESEKLVQAALDGLLYGTRKRTTVVVAHRLSTIRNADKICILENDGAGAKVVEEGTHDELMRAGGRYVALRAAYDDDNE
jgi:ATP-binding cassette subfamily B (MDR/TAP) protein 1